MPEKSVVRTENAPAPFQGAPYSQGIKAGDYVFVSGQLGLGPGDTEFKDGITEQTEQIFRNISGDPRGGGERARPARQDDGLPRRPRRLPGDERGLREARRRRSARALDGRDLRAAAGSEGGNRGRRPPLTPQWSAVKAATVIATPRQHGLRRLRVDAGCAQALSRTPSSAWPGSLNRNVREFSPGCTRRSSSSTRPPGWTRPRSAA